MTCQLHEATAPRRDATGRVRLAKVFKILIETGVKTPEEVEARFWDWEETTAEEARA